MVDSAYVNIMRIFVNILDGFVTVSVMHMYFSERIRLRIFLIISLCIGVILNLFDVITNIYPNMFSWSVLMFGYLAVTACSKFSVKKKIDELIIPLMVFSILNILYPPIVFLILHTLEINIQEFLNSPALIIINVVLYIIDFYVLYQAKKVMVIIKYKYKIDKRKIIILTVYTILVMIMITINTNVIYWYTGKEIGLRIAMLLPTIFLLYSAFNLIFYINLWRYENVKIEILDQKRYHESIKTYNRELSVIKHGYDNILATVSGFVNKEQWGPLAEYLEEVMESHRILDNRLLMDKEANK